MGSTSRAVVFLVLGLIGCGVRGAEPSASGFYSTPFQKTPSAADLTQLGRALFFDPSLSASGAMACSTCHDPRHAFGPPNALPVQRGGGDGRHAGVRAVMSLMYTQTIPPFTEHFFDDEGDDSIDQGPAGGRTWDGRAQSAHEQASLPLFSPFEMGNESPDAVIARLARGPRAALFREIFGEGIFETPSTAFKGLLMALEAFQQSPAEFYPYTSKYDAWLRGRTSLSPVEARGLAAFNDPGRGNCARCHPSARRGGAFPQFTDFGYAAIAPPRNRAIPANADRHYTDLGLCGPLREDLRDRADYCGLFRTPSLRNVATRSVFFHNGVVHGLDEAVRFYAERDVAPQKWYPTTPHGAVQIYDDVPQPYRVNIDREPPFDRDPGDKPALSDQDIHDIVAFLKTLTDGYRP